MSDYARSLLQELMSPYEKSKKKHFDAEDVCKHFLVRFCPNNLFINTKSDLGPCLKDHDESLKKEYQESPDKDKYGYEEKFYDYLENLCSDLDRKIRRGQDRLNSNPDELNNPTRDEHEEKKVMLDVKFKDLLNLALTASMDGKVMEGLELTRQAMNLQNELHNLIANEENNPILKQEKRMEVCDVCGAFLVMHDATKRLDAHLEGKQHTGFLKIREAMQELEPVYGGRRFKGRREKFLLHGGGRSGRDYRDRDHERPRGRDFHRRSSKDHGYHKSYEKGSSPYRRR